MTCGLFLLALLPQQGDPFPLREGDRWIYRVLGPQGAKAERLTKEVVGRETLGAQECLQVRDRGFGGSTLFSYHRSEDGVYVYRLDDPVPSPFPWLKLPLEKGASWSHTIELDEGKSPLHLDFSVQGREKITVPAGTFQAWRVTLRGEASREPAVLEADMWFADDVGEVKRIVRMKRGEKVEELVLELEKFEIRPPIPPGAYYPLGKGYTWTYVARTGGEVIQVTKAITGTERVGGVECFVIEDPAYGGYMRTMYMAPGEAGILVRRMRRALSKPFIWLKLPMRSGDAWEAALESPEIEETAVLKFRVGDEEEVEVPAGKFRARKVHLAGTDENGTGIEVTMWLAPGVGEVRRSMKLLKRGKIIRELDMRLKKFSR